MEFRVGGLGKLIASGALLLAMGISIGLLDIHRVQVVAIAVLVAAAIVLVAWRAGHVHKFGRAEPLVDEERKAAEAELGPGVPVSLSRDRGSPRPWR
jgi:hypothetical protein